MTELPDITWGKDPDDRVTLVKYLVNEARQKPNVWGSIEVDNVGTLNYLRSAMRKTDEGNLDVRGKTIVPDKRWLLSFRFYTIDDEGNPTKWALDNPAEAVIAEAAGIGSLEANDLTDEVMGKTLVTFK